MRTMMVAVAVVVWVATNSGAATPATGTPVLWGANGAGGDPNQADPAQPTSSLFRIDPTTGTATEVGPIGFALTGLAVDPTTGVLYGATTPNSETGDSSLITIDRLTGQGTLVGNMGGGQYAPDLAFREDGQLFGWMEGSDDLATINKTTGAATIVVDSTLDTYGAGLAFCGNNLGLPHTLLLAARGVDGPRHTISPATGTSTNATTLTSNDFSNDEPIAALTCRKPRLGEDHRRDVLYGTVLDFAAPTRPASLVTISATGSEVTVVGPTADRMDALEFEEASARPAAIPDVVVPGTDVLFRANAETASGEPLTITWDFGDGSTGTGDEATHAYTSTGTFTIAMKAVDPIGAEVNATSTVVVVAPVPGIRQQLVGVNGGGDYRGIGNPGNTHLLRIDPANGSAVRVGPTAHSVTGIAQDPTTGVLYGATGGFDTEPENVLVTIDLATGAATVVAAFASTDTTLADLAFDPAGQLYGWNEDGDDLYRIDKATAAITLVGESGNGTNGSGISFDAAGTTLYLAGDDNDGPLATVDTTSGVSTDGPTLVGGADGETGAAVPAMTRAIDGALFGTLNAFDDDFPGPFFLATINPVTGAVTDVGLTVDRLDAIEFVAPDPLTVVKLTAKLNFAEANKDAILVKGRLVLPEGFTFEGALVRGDIDGALFEATLNKKGKSKAFKLKKTGKFVAKLTKGAFAAALADDGLTNETVSDKAVEVLAKLELAGHVFFGTKAGTYNATQGKVGKFQ